jgi:putative tricarboxylic transport membrane protein
MLKGGFTPIPLLLGLVLGQLVETNYHRALLISGGSFTIFWASPISKVLIVLIVLSLAGPYLGPFWKTLTQGEK